MLASQEYGSGQSVIILHGFLGSSDNWRGIAKNYLTNYNVHLLDLRNHGKSFHNQDISYQSMAADVDQYIEAKKIKNPIIIGHSMGGKVAIQSAINKSYTIKKLIIVDIAPITYRPHHDDVLHALKEINLTDINQISDAENEFSKYLKDKNIRQFLIKNIRRDEDGQFKWKINKNALINSYNEILISPESNEAINIPTLFIKGEKSEYITTAETGIINKQFTNAKIKTINGVGHWVQAEAPKQFSDMTISFIEEDKQ